jgi:hypothetical protein
MSEEKKLIHLIESKDYGSAGIDSDSVNMGAVHSLSAYFSFGALTSNSILKVYSGATAGTKTTAMAFEYRMASGDYKASSADLFGAATAVASSGLTLTATTFDHRAVEIAVDSDQMTDGEKWLTFEIDSTASALNVAAVGIANGRYPGNAQPTAI